MSNSPSRSRGALLRPGFATLLHSPRTRGGRSADPPNVMHPRAAQCNGLARKSLQRLRIIKKLSTVVQPRALTRNGMKCRSNCGSDRMLVVRSGSRAEVEKKAVRLSGVIGDHRVFRLLVFISNCYATLWSILWSTIRADHRGTWGGIGSNGARHSPAHPVAAQARPQARALWRRRRALS